jgi:peptide/nickel transport system substrate-binding protein
MSLLYEAGKDNKDFTNWDEETQTKFWTDLETAGTAFAQEIVDTCIAEGYNKEGDSVSACAANWGFEIPEDATAADFFWAMAESYGGDFNALSSTESAGSSLADLGFDPADYAIGVKTGDSADSISGIQKTGDYSLKVTLTEPDATAIYQLGIAIAPLHYYGETDKYDYDNNKFGFPKNDLSIVRDKTTKPLGAGPYTFKEYANKIAYLEANENYYLGAPSVSELQFKETQEADKVPGVVQGTTDICEPSFSKATAEQIASENSENDIP